MKLAPCNKHKGDQSLICVKIRHDNGEEATQKEIFNEIEKLRGLLRRYRTETPLCYQPHMIGHLVDDALANKSDELAEYRKKVLMEAADYFAGKPCKMFTIATIEDTLRRMAQEDDKAMIAASKEEKR